MLTPLAPTLTGPDIAQAPQVLQELLSTVVVWAIAVVVGAVAVSGLVKVLAARSPAHPSDRARRLWPLPSRAAAQPDRNDRQGGSP